MTSYFESRGRRTNASIANQTPAAAAETYVVGSDVTVPTGRLQAKSMYRCRLKVAKTAAGTVSPTLAVRFGINATTADTARATLTFAPQTAVADSGMIDVYVTFRAVGASGAIFAVGLLDHQLAATGLSTVNSSVVEIVSNAFDTTVANSKIGLSINTGTSAAWTLSLVQSELLNLA